MQREFHKKVKVFEQLRRPCIGLHEMWWNIKSAACFKRLSFLCLSRQGRTHLESHIAPWFGLAYGLSHRQCWPTQLSRHHMWPSSRRCVRSTNLTVRRKFLWTQASEETSSTATITTELWMAKRHSSRTALCWRPPSPMLLWGIWASLRQCLSSTSSA